MKNLLAIAKPLPVILSGLLFVSVSFLVALQIARCVWPQQSIALTYVGLALIPLSFGLLLRLVFPHLVSRRRTVESSELESVYAEVEQYGSFLGDNAEQAIAKANADKAKAKVEGLDRPIYEYDVLPLRQSLVDLYCPDAELVGKARSDLDYLEEYTYGDDEQDDDGIAARVEGIIEELEKVALDHVGGENNNTRRGEFVARLRADVKALRDTIAWYDKTWAIGEWLRTCVTCWVSVTIFASLLVGILPVVHTQGRWTLSILHWVALGVAGALLAILLRLHKMDLPELGETEGKQLLAQTIRSIAIGAVTAVVLYAAIWGDVLDGKIFPDLSVNPSERGVANDTVALIDLDCLKNVGLSVFWGILAGLSPEVLSRLTRIAESSLSEPVSRAKK